MKASCIQMNTVLGDKVENLKKAERLIEEAIREGAKLIVLPELFNTGYRVEEHDAALAETIPGETTAWMTTLSQKYEIYLIGCILESHVSRGLVYDTAVITGPKGVLGLYRKQKLWGAEKNRFVKGNELTLVDIGDAKIGLLICYEVGFPEPARFLAKNGADILVYSSAFGEARSYAWDLATRARALENGCYVLASNRSGTEKNETVFAGMSRIVDPKGVVLVEAEKENDMILFDLDLETVVKQRQAIPYLRDVAYYDEKGRIRND
jgi:predicted amidohydrolase